MKSKKPVKKTIREMIQESFANDPLTIQDQKMGRSKGWDVPDYKYSGKKRSVPIHEP